MKRLVNVNFLLLLASLLLAVCFFCRLELIDLGNFFNSDSLYLPALYKDLFVDKTGLQGWHLNPAPNFFPDMLAYFVLMFLLGHQFIVVSFVFALLQYFLILYLLVRLFKKIAPGRSKNFYAVIYLLQLLWLLEVHFFSGNFIFAYFLFSNAYHTGSFVITLCCFLVVLDLFKKQAGLKPYGLFVLVFLGTLSDQLFIIMFVAPLVFASLFLLRQHGRLSLLLMAVSIVAAGLAAWAYNAINTSGYVYFDKPVLSFELKSMLNSYHIFMSLVQEYTVVFGFRTVCMYLFLASQVCLFVLLIKNRRSMNSLLIFSLVFIIAQAFIVIPFPIICGNFTGFDTFRYNIYPLYLTGLNFSIFLALRMRRTVWAKTGYKYAMLAAGVCIMAGGISEYSYKRLYAFFTYYPQTARRVDEVAEKEGLLRGVGNYWYAKSTSLFSKKGVKIYPVFEHDLAIYFHVLNENWYFNSDNKFNFVLLNNFADTTSYRKKLLYARVLYNEPGFQLAKTNIFNYDKWNFVPKNN